MIYILFLAFFIRTVRNTLYQVFLWQIKEYRFDRMLAHLRTRQGKRMVFGPMAIIKWGVIAAYFLDLPIFWPVLFLYVFEAFLNLKEAKRGIKKPVFTLKATVVVIIVIAGQIFLLLWPFLNHFFGIIPLMFILDKLLAPTIGLFFLLLSIPTKLQRQMVIEQAKTIIFKHPNLITIGITGSYGKTSTKEFLTQILAQKFRVLKTEGSQNTDIGIAKTIIEKLSDQEIFVCEMGAYKIGEIRQICQICRPKIGIITGINEQHLDLFGSLKKTMEAKYELVEALPPDGLAVFNGNNQYCLEMAKKAMMIGEIRVIGEDIKAEDIKVFKDKLEFKVFKALKFQKMTAHLLGKQNVENILAAIVVAKHLGMSLEEIAKAVEKLEPPEKTMKAYHNLVDDTFNANPDGVLAALEYMKVYAGKKILVLTPMIELGEKAKEAHQKVGRLAGEVCDLIILTNKNYHEEFGEKVWVGQGNEAAGKIRKTLDKDGVAVFEGKESKRILGEIRDSL